MQKQEPRDVYAGTNSQVVLDTPLGLLGPENPLPTDVTEEKVRSQTLPSDGSQEGAGEKITRFAEDTICNEKSRANPRWSKPIKPWDTVYEETRAGEDSMPTTLSGKDQLPLWEEGVLPPDLLEFNFTALGEGARRVAVLTDTWKKLIILVHRFLHWSRP